MSQLQLSLTDHIPEEQTERIRFLLSLPKRKLSTQQIIETGRLLIAVEQQLKPSEWRQWTKSSIGQCRRTIQFLKSVARFADSLDDASCLHSLPRYFLYCLASSKHTKQAIEQTLETCRLVGQGSLSEQIIEDEVVKELKAQHYEVKRQVSYHEVGKIDIVVRDTAVIEVELYLRRSKLFHAVGQALIYRQIHDPKLKAVVVGLPHPDCPADSSLFQAAKDLGVQIWLLRPPYFSIPKAW